MSSRRALVKHLWAMVQTRAEAASLVVKLQRTAMTQGLLLYAVAGFAAMAFATAVIVLIAVAAPPEWRVLALSIVAGVLLLTAILGAVGAGRRLERDAGVIEDFSRGLRLDMAMINLALKDPETEDQEKLEERERAKTKVREAAIAKAAAPSTAEGSGAPSSTGPSADVTSAAMRAAAPGAGAGTGGAASATGPEADGRRAGATADRAAPDAAGGMASAPAGATVGRSAEGATVAASLYAGAMAAGEPVVKRGGAYSTAANEPAGRTVPGSAAAPKDMPAGATEREMPEPPVTPPESMTAGLDRSGTTDNEVGSEAQRNREQIRGRA